MSVTLTLATAADGDRLARLIAACHEQVGLAQDEEERRAALAPLLEGSPHGAAYLIGPPKSPVGYVLLSFGWSLPRGGLVAHVEEIFIRHGVRGRGMATEALSRLMPALARHGVRALQIRLERDDERIRAVYKRMGFRAEAPGVVMTRTA